MAQLIDLFIDGAVFFDEGIGRGDIGFRLVVIVITDEILYRVMGKQFLELTVKLCRQGFVVSQHQGRALEARHDIGHGEGLTRTGNAKQHLMAVATFNTGHQFLDGLGLVTTGRVGRYQFKLRHGDFFEKGCFFASKR